MIRIGLVGLAASILLSGGVAEAADIDIVGELAQRSGMPPAQLEPLLANCDANQTSMYFCSWRDLIVADHELDAAREKRSAVSPACKKSVDRRLEEWPDNRDRQCKNAAAREYQGGSLEQTARLQCSISSTRDMTKKINAVHCSG
jgi:uncharacterized protein YecT (DUF1311 family)